MTATYTKNLDPAQKARRRRMLAAIHIEAARALAATGDWRKGLQDLVFHVSGGAATSAGDLPFDELRAIIQRLKGEAVTEPSFRKRLERAPVSQAEYCRQLIGRVNARSVTTGGPDDFSQRVLGAKVHEVDVELMTTPQLRQAIAILRSYVEPKKTKG